MRIHKYIQAHFANKIADLAGEVISCGNESLCGAIKLMETLTCGLINADVAVAAGIDQNPSISGASRQQLWRPAALGVSSAKSSLKVREHLDCVA